MSRRHSTSMRTSKSSERIWFCGWPRFHLDHCAEKGLGQQRNSGRRRGRRTQGLRSREHRKPRRHWSWCSVRTHYGVSDQRGGNAEFWRRSRGGIARCSGYARPRLNESESKLKASPSETNALSWTETVAVVLREAVSF